MRIKQISVTKLFGIFDHVIPLNREDRVTIIHGANGFGKTTLLRMINGLFNSRYSELWVIHYKDFRIEFDDGSTIIVHKFINKESQWDGENELVLSFINNGKRYDFLPGIETKNQLPIPIDTIQTLIPELARVGSTTWIFLPTNEVLSLEDVWEKFGEILLILSPSQKEATWLEKIKESINIRLIESQRLLKPNDNRRSQGYDKRQSMFPSVATYAKELAEEIQAKLTEYGQLAQSLDRTFPVRVVQQKALSQLTDEKLRHQLNQLEEKRSQLVNAGLLNKDEDYAFQVQEEIDESTKKVLSVYIEDVDKKLSVFNDIAAKTDLFKRIINDKFSHKQIAISKDNGFSFTTSDGNFLSPTDLSSGEQHELVLLYELLFKVKPNSLILIDEPELSLHVEWQVQFLKDLQQITKLANIDILMATHSPDIIHDRWDLTVELMVRKSSTLPNPESSILKLAEW